MVGVDVHQHLHVGIGLAVQLGLDAGAAQFAVLGALPRVGADHQDVLRHALGQPLEGAAGRALRGHVHRGEVAVQVAVVAEAGSCPQQCQDEQHGQRDAATVPARGAGGCRRRSAGGGIVLRGAPGFGGGGARHGTTA